ncbi:MAG: sortase [Candidatus Adlerbacteria bacterium]
MEKTNKGIVGEIGERRGAFVAMFLGMFLLTVLFLKSVDAVPEPLHPLVTSEPAITNNMAVVAGVATSTPEAPVRIVAKKIGLDVSIKNPGSTDLKVLDDALLTGAVRYPSSALLGSEGTVLLFGHSSYLPIVHNQAYKAFDGIQNLKPGERVSVYSEGTEYRYSVVQVKVADATQDSIELKTTGKHLTLVTCDSFASKSNRFIVTADFVGAYAVAGQ